MLMKDNQSTKPRIQIQPVSNITRAIGNLVVGDWLFLDIDETLLLTGILRFGEDLRLTEENLAAAIRHVQSLGIKVFGLTARHPNSADKTTEQLKQLGVELDGIIYSPNDHSDPNESKSTKGSALEGFILQRINLNTLKVQRIFVFDDLLVNLNNIETVCTNLGIPLFLKHYRRPHHQPILVNDLTNSFFPSQLDGFEIEKQLGGGTGSVFSIVNPTTRQRLVIKGGAHLEAGKVEILCHALYHTLGVNVPKMRVYNTLPKSLANALGLRSPYGLFQVCEFIEEDKEQPTQAIIDTACRHYLILACIGNTDIAKKDNFVAGVNNRVYLVDAGANFQFKALGERREDNPIEANEVDTLRTPHVNLTGSQWFGSLRANELEDQARQLITHSDTIEKTVWEISSHLSLPDDLRNQFIEYLSDRLDRISTRFCANPQSFAKRDKKALQHQTGAGILIVTSKEGKQLVLLSRRSGHDWYDNFGGKSDTHDHNLSDSLQRNDQYLCDTARGEVLEESNKLLNFTHYEMNNSTFHDLVTITETGTVFLYRMYIIPHAWIDPVLFTDKEHSAHEWVPLEAIIKTIESTDPSTVILEESRTIPLFPPLCAMLLQAPVKANLRHLSSYGFLLPTRTLGREGVEALVTLQHRPISTPALRHHQIANTMLRRSGVLSEIKTQRMEQPAASNNKNERLRTQSEIHLKAILQDQYVENDLEANVRLFIRLHYKRHTENERGELKEVKKLDRFVQHSVDFICNERTSDDICYVHAVPSNIKFSYDVYTLMYQLLQADNRCITFRPNSEHLKRFSNISEFIAYYSNNGTQSINDHTNNHFNDCALSTNLFYFGNHKNPGSSSPDYLLHDAGAREVDLPNLLANFLRPLGVPQLDIDKLCDFYQSNASHFGGSLYQIAMSLEQTRRLCYPAASGGRVNEFEGSRDIPDILRKLAEDKTPSDYIETLQARNMLPPDEPLRTQVFRWKEISQEEEQRYQDNLKRCVESIVYAVLIRDDPTLSPEHEAPALRILPSIMAENHLSLVTKLTSDTLRTAIHNNNESLIRQILLTCPQLLSTKMLRRLEVHSVFKSAQHPLNKISNELMHPLEIMIDAITPVDTIVFCYGEQWINIIADNFINDSASLIPYLQKRFFDKLAAVHRLALAMRISEVIVLESANFLFLVEYIDENDRYQFACAHRHLITSFETVQKVIKLLKVDHRFNFALDHEDKLTKSTELAAIADTMSDADSLEFESARIMSHDGLIRVLTKINKLSKLDCLAFASHNIDKIDDQYDQYGYVAVARVIHKSLRHLFAAKIHHHITEFHMAHALLELLPAQRRLSLAVSFIDIIVPKCENIEKIYKLLPKEDHLQFSKLIFQKRKDYKALAILFRYAPFEKWSRFSYPKNDSRRKIDPRYMYRASLFISDHLKLSYALNMVRKDIFDLVSELRKLPEEDRLIFACSNQDKITDSTIFEEIFELLPEADRLEFAVANCRNISENFLNQIKQDNLETFLMLRRAIGESSGYSLGPRVRSICDEMPSALENRFRAIEVY